MSFTISDTDDFEFDWERDDQSLNPFLPPLEVDKGIKDQVPDFSGLADAISGNMVSLQADNTCTQNGDDAALGSFSLTEAESFRAGMSIETLELQVPAPVRTPFTPESAPNWTPLAPQSIPDWLSLTPESGIDPQKLIKPPIREQNAPSEPRWQDLDRDWPSTEPQTWRSVAPSTSQWQNLTRNWPLSWLGMWLPTPPTASRQLSGRNWLGATPEFSFEPQAPSRAPNSELFPAPKPVPLFLITQQDQHERLMWAFMAPSYVNDPEPLYPAQAPYAQDVSPAPQPYPEKTLSSRTTATDSNPPTTRKRKRSSIFAGTPTSDGQSPEETNSSVPSSTTASTKGKRTHPEGMMKAINAKFYTKFKADISERNRKSHARRMQDPVYRAARAHRQRKARARAKILKDDREEDDQRDEEEGESEDGEDDEEEVLPRKLRPRPKSEGVGLSSSTRPRE